MDVIEMNVSDLIPYDKNPRHNEESIDYVANSIKEFGFKVPIVVDKDNVIVAGHTRLLASKKLGIKKVPCIIADDLTPEQIKAYRLADNKVSEKSTWDLDLLSLELDEIKDIDMSDFDFDLGDFEVHNVFSDDETDESQDTEEDDDGYYGDAREMTYKKNNFDVYDDTRVAGFFDIPVIYPEYHIPKDLISFNYVLTSNEFDKGVHFFIDDYQFERVWNKPDYYIEKLKQFDCVFTPDFSLYTDMPMALKLWNVYRSRMFGQMMQDAGIKVIPTLQWSQEGTFKFCFDGLPKHSVVAVSTIGVKVDKAKTAIWRSGMDEAIRRLQPQAIIVYGGKIDYDFGKIKTIYIENKNTERMSNAGKVASEQDETGNI